MVDSSVQLSVIRSQYYWKVVVERCTCYLGQHSIMQSLSRKKGAKQWESNLKSSIQVLSLSRIFNFVGLFFHVVTGYRQVLAISTIKTADFQVGLTCGKSAALDTVAVEVYPSTTPILQGKFLHTSLNKKGFSQVSLCRHQPSVSTFKYRPGSAGQPI